MTETRPRRLASPAETRPRRDVQISRRDVCRSRDVTETLKCIFNVINAVLLLKQVNVVGLTTVAILSPHVCLFHGRYTARTWPCTRPSAWSCTRSCTLLCTGRKHGRALRAVYTAVLYGPCTRLCM